MSKKKKQDKKLKAAANSLTKTQVDLTSNEFWTHFLSGGGSRVVTAEKSLSITAVWACVRFLAETISTLPLKVYRKLPDGSREEAKRHPLHNVLCVDPNKDQTPMKLMQFIVACISLGGNCRFEKKRNGNRLIALNPINPAQYRGIDKLDNGRYRYKFVDEKGVPYELDEADVWMISGFNGLNTLLGIDPIYKGRQVMADAQSANESAANFFQNGMSAGGFLSTDKLLNDKQRDDLNGNLEKYIGSKNAAKLMVLEAGMKFEGISIDPEAAQLLETRGYNAEEICRFFRVPPVLVGYVDKQSSWSASIEGMTQQVLTFTLLPILINIEQAISKSLVLATERSDIYAEFNVEGFLRADSTGRANYYGAMLDHGVFNRDEIRRKENMPPMPAGGGIFTVQSALIPIEQVGKNYEKTVSTNE